MAVSCYFVLVERTPELASHGVRVSPSLPSYFEAELHALVVGVTNFFGVVKTAEVASHGFSGFARAPIVFCDRITALWS